MALSAALLGSRLLPEGKGKPVAWLDVSGVVGPLEIAGAQRRVFTDRKTLAAYLRRYSTRSGETPQFDFERRQLLLVTAGPRSSTGYGIDILGVRDRGGKIVVRVRERTPRLEDKVEARLTRPFRVLSLPAGSGVDVDWVGR